MYSDKESPLICFIDDGISGNCGLDRSTYSLCAYPNGGIEFEACSVHTLRGASFGGQVIGPGNSYAAPVVAAHVYQLIRENPSLTSAEVRQRLIESGAKTNGLPIHQQLAYHNSKVGERTIPLVIIAGEKSEPIVRDLCKSFCRDNYFAIVFTENKIYAGRNEWIYANSTRDWERCKSMAVFYYVDLMLFILDKRVDHAGNQPADLALVSNLKVELDWACEAVCQVNENNAYGELIALIGSD